MTEKARAEKAAHEFDGAIWSELKTWLFEHVFHDKCAYCEAPVRVTGYGSADHHRLGATIDDRSELEQVAGQHHHVEIGRDLEHPIELRE